ncbi:restriction endonuclease subunit S [Kitasatospora sp. NPDC059817]|uniref:restriction endonuclease subunit S n=1 Tax=Kitasatospora sp. NPDC059817 TaxID=3346961 RepID=UPI00365F1815
MIREVAKLGDIATFIRGITFKPDDVVPSGTPGSVQCMRTKNVQAEIDLSDVWSVDSRFVKRTEQYLQAGDLLVSSANSWNLVGKCCWVPEAASGSTFGGFISVLRPDRERVDPRYLYRWFASDRIQATVRSFGRQTTNISNLDFARCLSLPIALPSLKEQQRIAQVLDHAAAVRAKRREAIALLDDLTQSVFIDMFGDPSRNPYGWPARKMQDLLDGSLRNGLSPATGGTVQAKVLTLSAITGKRFDATAFKVSGFKSTPPREQSVCSADFLICRGNGNSGLVGRGHFPPFDMPDVTYPDTIISLRPSSLLRPGYLQCVWNSGLVRRQIDSSARTTNGTFKINQKGIESVSIPVPPLDLQELFESRIAPITDLQKTQASHLAELDSLFASLQHRAFRGEL